jgi:hypothetical protein
MASRPAKRPAKPKVPAFDPTPMFDLDAYCTEHPPSVKRIRAMQEAAQAEAADEKIPVAARRHNLIRMTRWIETLLDQLAANHEGDDHDGTDPNARVPPGRRAG